MARKSKPSIWAALVTLGTMAILVWFFYHRQMIDIPDTADWNSVFAVDERAEPGVCGEVLSSCTVVTEIDTEICDESGAREQIELALGKPSERPECEVAKMRLKNSCPEGCAFKTNSLLSILGEIQFDIFPKDDSEICLIEGHRSLSMSGQCVRPNDTVR